MNQGAVRRAFALAVVFGLGLLVLAGAHSASARADRFRIERSHDIVLTFCDFDVRWVRESHADVLIVPERDGSYRVVVVTYHTRSTFTNLETGKVVTAIGFGPDLIREGELSILGGVVYFSSERGGAVMLDVGRIVIDLSTGEVLAVNGPHEFNPDSFCAMMA